MEGWSMGGAGSCQAPGIKQLICCDCRGKMIYFFFDENGLQIVINL